MDEEKEAKNLSIDDLFTEANYSGADCVLEQDMILGRWDNSDIKQVGYKYLKALLEQIP